MEISSSLQRVFHPRVNVLGLKSVLITCKDHAEKATFFFLLKSFIRGLKKTGQTVVRISRLRRRGEV